LNLILWTISKTSENVLSPNLLICSWPFHGFALLNFRSDRIGFQLHSQAGQAVTRSCLSSLVKPWNLVGCVLSRQEHRHEAETKKKQCKC
jgi:hypothetical protein